MKIKERLYKSLQSLKRNWWLFLLQLLCISPITFFMIGADLILQCKVEVGKNNPVLYTVCGIEFTYVHFIFILYACIFCILFVGLLLCIYLWLWQIIDKRNKKYDRQVESKK